MYYSYNKVSLKFIFCLLAVLFFSTVKLIAQPLAADAGVNQTICSESTVTIGGTPTATYGAGGYTYFWSPSTGLSSTTVSNPTASPTTTTTYTLQVSDALSAVAADVITITVNPLPTVDAILSPSTCNGSTTSITSFASTPAGATFNWTNSDPSIGLAASGTGTVPSFTATNTGSTPVVATISVTATLAGCSGPPMIYNITVRPSPIVTAVLSSLVCNGTLRPTTNYTSTPSGASFIWSNTNTAIGLGSGGAGNTPSYTATNTGSTVIGGVISVTANLAGCTGPTINYNSTVKPTPIVTSSPLIDTRCSGINSNFALTSTVVGTTFDWTTNGVGVSGNTASSGTVISQGVNATGSATGTANYFVTPTAAGCVGSIINPVLTVNPIPVATATTSPLTRCSGDTVSFTVTSNIAGTTFTWSSFETNASGADPSGTGPSVFDTVAATTISAGTITYIFTPFAGGCAGSQAFPFVTINPPVNSDFSYSSSGCQFSANALPSFLPGASAGTFTSIPPGMVISPSTGEIDLTTSTPGSYIVTNTIAAAGGCPSTNHNNGFTITPFPDVNASPAAYPAMCSGDIASVTFSSSFAGTTFPWTSTEMLTSGSALSGTGNISELLSAFPLSGTTTYTITPTIGGCVGPPITYSVGVTAAPNANFTFPAGPFCQFGPNVFPGFPGTANAGIFSATPAGLVFVDTLTGEIDITASAPGTYDITNTIAASGGCPAISYTLTGFTISPYLDPTITPVAPICITTPMFFLSAASSGGSWSGPGIIVASTGQFDASNAGVGTHTITYTTPFPCSNVDTILLSVGYRDIHGKVSYSGGTMTSGTNTAVLFNYVTGSYLSLDTVQVSAVDAFGYYHFAAVPQGQYLIKVFADTILYPLAVPTYYDSEFLWDTAQIKSHGCTNDTADVYVIEGVATAGPGMLSGQVTEGFGFVRTPGDPIPGLDVKLGKNPGGALVTNTQTGPTGSFTFSNIPINIPGEFYTIYIDVPGLQRDSTHNIIVTSANFIFTQLDYEADSASVYPLFPLTTSIASATNKNQFTVFPNPAKSNLTIEYILTKTEFVQLEVFDLLGKKQESLVDKMQAAGKQQINLNNMNPGVYFIKLTVQDQTNTIRLVVID